MNFFERLLIKGGKYIPCVVWDGGRECQCSRSLDVSWSRLQRTILSTLREIDLCELLEIP
jgi:hypothetical protein